VSCAPPEPPCEGGEACDPTNGQCEPASDAPIGTPCDTDSNPNTEEQCDGQGECSDDPPLDLCENLLGEFKGYTLNRRGGFLPLDVTLDDQFESKITTVRRPKYLANPAGIDGAPIDDPTAHMMCYVLKDVSGQVPLALTDVRLESQFGTDFVTAVRSDLLCVQAAKDLVPVATPFDRFKCYRVRKQRGAPRFVKRDVNVIDQFENKEMTLSRPFLVCNPVGRDGEEIQNPVCHLSCYKIKDVLGQPKFVDQDAIIEDEFGTQNVGTNTNVRETCHRSAVLCVPALKFHD
jgi:hypothetical protein